VDADPAWGDAWVLHARALDATRDAPAAARAWETVAQGVEPATPLWLEAQLAQAAALQRAGDDPSRCRALGRARGHQDAPAAARERLAAAAKDCPAAP
jgi:hypothetical protein